MISFPLDMERFLRPRSIAVVGVAPRRASWGRILFRNLLEGGFRGEAWPVSREGGEVLGRRVLQSVEELPPVDLAALAVPREEVLGVVEALLRRGTRAFVVITAGFGESSPEGGRLEAELARLVRDRGGQDARAELLRPL